VIVTAVPALTGLDGENAKLAVVASLWATARPGNNNAAVTIPQAVHFKFARSDVFMMPFLSNSVELPKVLTVTNCFP
jgi:hypothetical protein